MAPRGKPNNHERRTCPPHPADHTSLRSPGHGLGRGPGAARCHLPTAYKELIRAYGGSNWDDYLYLLESGCPNDNYDLIDWEDQQTEALEGLWEFEKKADELADPGSRVVPWAAADNGECLYWLVKTG